MNQEPSVENPYSSPGARVAGVTGAVWDEDRVTIQFDRVVEDYAVVEWCGLTGGV